MYVLFAFSPHRGRTEGTKKTTPAVPGVARKEPIRLIAGQVNRVMRIGASSRGQSKKLPWKCTRAEFDPAKCLFPQRAGQSRLRPDGVLPSFARLRDFPGAKIGGAFDLDISPYEWSWSLTALPRFGQPSARRMAGEVSEHGRMRPGADREARRRCLCSPYKRKAVLCPENTAMTEYRRTLEQQAERDRQLWKQAQRKDG